MSYTLDDMMADLEGMKQRFQNSGGDDVLVEVLGHNSLGDFGLETERVVSVRRDHTRGVIVIETE